MATITKRGNSYRIRVSHGYDDNGKQIVSSMTWTPDPKLSLKQAEKEVQKIALSFEEKMKKQKKKDFSRLFLRDFCMQYLELVKNNISPTTYYSYQQTIQNYIIPALGHIPLNSLKPIHIQLFINQMCRPGARADGKTDTAIAPSTLRRNYSVLRSILTKAYKLELISSNPANSQKIDLPSLAADQTDIFTKQEFIQILNCLENEPLMYQVLIHFAFVTGCRRGELVALTWNDIDFEQKTISINKSNYQLSGSPIQTKAPKTKNSIRTISLSDSILELLQKYKQHQKQHITPYKQNWIFTQWNGTPMHPSTPTHWFGKFLKKNNIAHRKFHAIRHTSATLLLSSGIDIKTVSGRLGHTDISTTNRYVHMVSEADKIAAKTFDAILNHTEKN